MKTHLEINGEAFSTLEEFAEHFSSKILGGYRWEGNLDALNDVLRGGFGTPADGFVLVWRNHRLSQERLGHAEAARRLERILTTCHPANVSRIKVELEDAQERRGPTLFDMLVQIIRDHGSGGSQPDDAIDLVLD